MAPLDYLSKSGLVTLVQKIKDLPVKIHEHNASEIIKVGNTSTAAGTADKVVNLSGYERTVGDIILVLFDAANTVANPRLNVNNTGFANVWNGRTNANVTENEMHGREHLFRWNGTQWMLLNPMYAIAFPVAIGGTGQTTIANAARHMGIVYTTVSTAGNVAEKLTETGLTGWSRNIGAIASVRFNNVNTAINPTLGVNGVNSAPIFDYRTNTNVEVGSFATEPNMSHLFTWNGTNWILLNPVIQQGSILNRAIGSNDNATGTVNDTGNDISVPIAITTAEGTATRNLPPTALSTLRAWGVAVRNNLAWIVGRFNTEGHANRATTADRFTTGRNINGVAFDGSRDITIESQVYINRVQLSINAASFTNTAPFVQTITNSNILNNPTIVKTIFNENLSTRNNERRSAANITDFVISAGQVVVRCDSTRPTTNINVELLQL